jgi:hypothetical protein
MEVIWVIFKQGGGIHSKRLEDTYSFFILLFGHVMSDELFDSLNLANVSLGWVKNS